MKWGRCGARGRGTKRTPKLPGGAGAPPGDTTVPCQELADGGLSGLPEVQKTTVTQKAPASASRRRDETERRKRGPAP